MAYVRDGGTDVRGFGQLQVGPDAAAVAAAAGSVPTISPDAVNAAASGIATYVPFYLVAVAAGVTTFLVTRAMGGHKSKKHRR